MVLGVGECRSSHQVEFLFVDAGVRGDNFMCKISIRDRLGSYQFHRCLVLRVWAAAFQEFPQGTAGPTDRNATARDPKAYSPEP